MERKKKKVKPEVLPPTRTLSKSKEATEARRKIVAQAVIEGKTLKEAAISAGYSPISAEKQGSLILQQPETKKVFAHILEEAGVSDKFLADKIKNLMDAKKIQYFQKDGIVTDEREVDALETQRKTAELVSKLKGHLRDQSQIDINVGIMAMVVAAVGQAGPGNEGENEG